MTVDVILESVGRAESYNMFHPTFTLKMSKEQALALLSDVQRVLEELDRGDIEDED